VKSGIPDPLNPPVVAIQKVQDNNFSAALEKVLDPVVDSQELRGRRVLLKPNLVEPLSYTSGQTTNPALVEAVVRWCRAGGAGEIAIGEGPSYFQPAYALKDCFVKTGMTAVAERQKIAWLLFDDGPFRKFENYSPDLPARFSLSEHAFCWDLIINLPVPKTHYLTGVSIAMKNLKGFIKRNDKPSFHYCGQENIHGSVTALNRMIRPFVNIVDGTAPVHRNKSFIAAGKDIVAIDTAICSLMGINPERIRTIVLGSCAGLGEKDMAKIEIKGEDLKDLQMNLEQPRAYLQRVFPGLQLHADTACSGCLIPLFSTLRRMEKEGPALPGKIHFVLGKEMPKDLSGRALFFGQCTRSLHGNHPWLNGCPPTREEMFAFVRDNL